MFRILSQVPLLLLLAAPLVACGGPPAAPEAVVGPTRLGATDVAPVLHQPISAGPRVSGVLDAAAKAVLRAEAGGEVRVVAAEVGQAVHKGDVLARIEGGVASAGDLSAGAGVTAAEQDVALTQRELERVRRLVEAGAVASRELDAVEAQAEGARARLKDARSRKAQAGKQLQGTVVRAPLDGVVSERAVSQGDVVAPGSPLFTVLDPSSLRLYGAVPADVVASLRVGAPVLLTVQGHGAQPFSGVVERVAPAVDPTTRQIPVIVSLPNTPGTLLAGLFAEGRVALATSEGLVVPADALTTTLEGVTVLRVRAGTVDRIVVTIGLRDEEGERVQVTGDLAVGDLVLVGPAREVAPGTTVVVAAPGAPSASAPAAER